MDDAEAQRQIDQMVKFIINEAKDKAAEIEIKAQEDFNVEKLKVLQASKDKIRAEYRKKAKQLETSRAIAQSTAVTKSRLKKIAARQQKINEAVRSANKSLADLSLDQTKYCKLCADLITQAMLRLLESNVIVRVRQQDASLIEAVLPSAERKFLAILESAGVHNATIKARIDRNNFLPPGEGREGQITCSGGVIVTSMDGRVTCDNTLDTRLNQVVLEVLPQMRRILYENPSDV